MEMETTIMTDRMILVRGGGDLATGVIHKLHQSGYHILILECDRPSAIRRHVAFCEAVYDGTSEVEGVVCRRIPETEIPAQCKSCWEKGEIPLLTDTEGKHIRELSPAAVIDAILAKKNLGTNRDMAPVTVGLGPGFTAGEDVDYVIETMRGHTLGRVLYTGSPLPNTGVPGVIGGQSALRILRAPAAGVFCPKMEIGQMVQAGDVAATVDGVPMVCAIDGCLRGLLHEGLEVFPGMKCGDVDPRANAANCLTASDKALAVGGGVLEALLHFGCLPDRQA